MNTTMQSHAQRLTAAQYQRLLANERARPHRASTRSHFIFYLPARDTWMTARAGRRRGEVLVRFFARCPCEDE